MTIPELTKAQLEADRKRRQARAAEFEEIRNRIVPKDEPKPLVVPIPGAVIEVNHKDSPSTGEGEG